MTSILLEQRLARRPHVGGLPVPYVVDERRRPIDFKVMRPEHVKRCATHRRCGICGGRIRGPLAFVGPADGRRCFADPWMHVDCAAAAMRLCPFLAGKKDWKDEAARRDPMLVRYSEGMALFTAGNGKAHRDSQGAWHFEVIGPLEPVA